MSHEVHTDHRSSGRLDGLDRPLYLLRQLRIGQRLVGPGRFQHAFRLVIDGDHPVGTPGSTPAQQVDGRGEGRPMKIRRRDDLDVLIGTFLPAVRVPSTDPHFLKQLVYLYPGQMVTPANPAERAGKFLEQALESGRERVRCSGHVRQPMPWRGRGQIQAGGKAVRVVPPYPWLR